MTLPWQFPDPLDQARRRADEFQRLSANDRVRQLLDTIETGMVLIHESPNRRAVHQMFLDRESEWQRIQAELFQKHGR